MNNDRDPYNSDERRRRVRRTKADRRESIRFEPGVDNRRRNPGRRAEDRDVETWRQQP